ncbi:hypothetical protein XOC_1415 [Xanthomonas oryzae pv. oryzicola BLS256]|uniref:Uncharacterized protein n=1 Tax=Xanthomonas oryzae pv. oryzicola (strain BLS256) TaxID=383407 RepID=G7TI76_XANOB|nr:hypothetical protein XOC_1415 [Xanthomonas oryzae pv. oryzicola BLS256]
MPMHFCVLYTQYGKRGWQRSETALQALFFAVPAAKLRTRVQ